eukprot:TRINITY_DN10039_c0_g2_i1.p1 TRINITY_DN10039_c0_g2~~TRINITY_DN10039_c0_g2_i1.p1  ORF type:complete len:149 (+),score=20.54 TRINITY_DN10039_c0_g2_i1:41-448(+)
MPLYRLPYYYVRGWGTPIARVHIGSSRLATLWKYTTPFPQHGCPEGYSRKREDYRKDFDAIRPYINKYRQITEARAHSGGQKSYYFCGIKGFFRTGLRKGQAHRRRRCKLKWGKGIKGSRLGLKFGMPWERSQLR